MAATFRALALLLAFAAAACVTQGKAGSGTTAAVADAAAGGRTVRLAEGGRTIVFRGDITYGTAQELLRLIKANPAVSTIQLTSNGGLAEPALLVANAIQLRRATTYAEGTCASACTFLFLGGQQRYIAPGAALGFHRAWQNLPGSDGTLQRLNAEIRARFAERGIAQPFVERVMATPADKLWYPSVEELEAAGVIDGVAGAGQLPR